MLIFQNGGFEVVVLASFPQEVTEESMQHRELLRIRRELDGGTVFGDGTHRNCAAFQGVGQIPAREQIVRGDLDRRAVFFDRFVDLVTVEQRQTKIIVWKRVAGFSRDGLLIFRNRLLQLCRVELGFFLVCLSSQRNADVVIGYRRFRVDSEYAFEIA